LRRRSHRTARPMSPLRRFGADVVSLDRVTALATASRGVHCTSECCLCRRTEPVGLGRSHLCLVVSDGPRWSSVCTGPCSLAGPGSSSRALRAPPEFLRHVRPPVVSPRRAPSLGSFRPSSRPQLAESTLDGRPRSVFVPPAAFRTLSTVCSSAHLARLFHRAAVSRVLAPGVSSH